ncbi:hypothetical protein JCM8097_008297 [Rhodosporidiobolus ruineniae]
MAVFSFLFGGNTQSRRGGSDHSLPSHSSYPTSSASSAAYPPAHAHASRPSGEYDDVALGGEGDLGGSALAYPDSRPSFSTPTATNGSFVGPSSSGSGAYSVEASYPPLPSFSRPSSSQHPSTTSRYPPIPQTFSRLRSLLSQQSPLLLDSLAPPPPYGARDAALLSLQSAIAPYRLPPAVIDSYLQHDGQDAFSLGSASSSTGLVYGLWWLPLERVEEEWSFWRKLECAGGLRRGTGVGGDAFSARAAEAPRGGRAHPYRPEEAGTEAGSTRAASEQEKDGEEDGDGVEGMSSFPPGWVRARYSHPGWLPLLTDRCGNYIGVDLDPPPPSSSASPASTPGGSRAHSRTGSMSISGAPVGYGQPGQVIAFGRELDSKVVLFPGDGPGGWARFLAAFVEDVERGEFARLGEKAGQARGWAGGEEDEEERAGRRRRAQNGSGSSEEDEEAYSGPGAASDGIGERGYFEEGVYGEEGGEEKRAASTWILTTPYRRLAASLDLTDSGGLIGLLCERSRRKWRSLGVGVGVGERTAKAAGRRPLSILVPNGNGTGKGKESMSTGVEAEQGEEDEDAKSAATMKAGPFSPDSQEEGENRPPALEGGEQTESSAADASASTVELVLSPPSPTATFGARLPPLSASSRQSEDSSTGVDPTVYLQQPPRSTKRSSKPSPQPRARRAPPPPAAPLDLPTFTDLDFSDAFNPADVPGYSRSGEGPGGRPVSLVPTASWLLNDSAAAVSAAASRLSFGNGGSRSPSPSLLPTFRSPVDAEPVSPTGGGAHASIPVQLHSREPTAEDDTDAVSLHGRGEAMKSTTALVSASGSPPTSPEMEGRSLEVVVEVGEGGQATADEPYR